MSDFKRATVNLTALTETRAQMTPGEYHAWGTTIMAHEPAPDHLDEDALIATATREDSAGIVAEHNAIPVLIEVARAALEFRDAHGALDDMMYVGIVSVDQLLGIDTVRDAKVKVNEAGATLLAVLAKVSP